MSYARPLLLTALLLALIALSWTRIADEPALSLTQSSFERALVSFALARSLNGVISVAQGTEVALQPAGVGVTLGAGQILDPLNDLVEQFSNLALLAATSLGMQLLLTELFANVWVNGALTALALGAIVTLWWSRCPPGVRRLTQHLAIAVLFLRFVFVAATLATSLIASATLAERQEAAIAYLSNTADELETATEEPPAGTSTDSLLERFDRFVDESRAALDVERRLAALERRVEAAIEHLVELFVLYVIETIVLPLAALALAVKALGSFWRRAG